MRSDEVQSKSLFLIMENCLPFTDHVMVVLVHKCVQQTHLLALHLETLGYIPRLLNTLNCLVYFLIIGDKTPVIIWQCHILCSENLYQLFKHRLLNVSKIL